MTDGTAKRMMQQRQPERMVSGQAFDEDARLDVSVRPKRLDEYIGQKRVKENIQIAIDAARSRDEALDHVLLYGPPGLGKTTLAQIIANELNVPIKTSAGPLLERKGDLTAILTSLELREVFFLDEIHRLQAAVEEVLYPAMEDFRVDLVIGQGPGARIHPFHLNHFTLIGATTRAGLITAPLRSRFGIVHRLEFYEPEDLLIILHRSAKILSIEMDEGGAEEIARRCRGTPRIANRLLRRARDFAEVRAAGRITRGVAQESLAMLGVDESGLDEVDRNLMIALLDKYSGGPVGLGVLAAGAAILAFALHSSAGDSPRPGDVTEARIAADAAAGANWLLNGRTFDAKHFSPLTQISDKNVSQLSLAWYLDIDSAMGVVSEPIVVDGVAYISAPQSKIYAVNAATGKLLWKFDPRVRLDMAINGSYSARTNGGVAVWNGKVFVGTGDCRLVAANAATGKEIWEATGCNPMQTGITGAPHIAKCRILIGYNGSDDGVRGALMAYDTETCVPSCRFWT